MTSNDLYLLLPELSLASFAMLLILLGSFFQLRKILAVVSVLGLVVPLLFTLMLLLDLESGSIDGHNVIRVGALETFVVDKFSLFFKFLFLTVATVFILISTEHLKRMESFSAEYYALVLFSTTGMMLLCSAVELITIYISLELATLPVVALTAFLRDARSSESGMKFLILSGISSAFLLYGMVLVWRARTYF